MSPLIVTPGPADDLVAKYWVSSLATPAPPPSNTEWSIVSNAATRRAASPNINGFYATVIDGQGAASAGVDITSVINNVGGTELNVGIVTIPPSSYQRCVAQILPASSPDPAAVRWIYSTNGSDTFHNLAAWTSWGPVASVFPITARLRYALDGAGVLKVTFTAANGTTVSASTSLVPAAKTFFDASTTIGMILMGSNNVVDSFGLTDHTIFDSFDRPDQVGLGFADTGQQWKYYPSS